MNRRLLISSKNRTRRRKTLHQSRPQYEKGNAMTIELSKEPLISMIVPVYKKDPDVLKRCLMRLEDQDYPNMEVLCVMDGPDVQLFDIIVPFLKEKRFRVVETEHGGACAARNAGFKASQGEIVSFFNSDYIAKPGM